MKTGFSFFQDLPLTEDELGISLFRLGLMIGDWGRGIVNVMFLALLMLGLMADRVRSDVNSDWLSLERDDG